MTEDLPSGPQHGPKTPRYPVLVVDDDLVSVRLLVRALRKAEIEVHTAENGVEALRMLTNAELGIRVVVADWMMPKLDGLELLRRVREKSGGRYVYFMLVTGRAESEDVVSGLRAGADDYMIKPADPWIFEHRVRAGFRVVLLEEELMEKNDELERLAMLDGLTGIPNRRAFDRDLDKAVPAAQRRGQPFSLVIFDVDHFKAYNDTLGHEAGDGALRGVASALASGLRATDSVYRYGGEEFICILEDADAQSAQLVAERLRLAVEARRSPHPGDPGGVVTVSAGVATFDPRVTTSPSELLNAADRALYRAKEGGRNRVETAVLHV